LWYDTPGDTPAKSLINLGGYDAGVSIAPGWYKDPAEPSTQRYWDGEGWVGEPLSIDATPPAGPPELAAPRRREVGPATEPGTATSGPGGVPPNGMFWSPPGHRPGVEQGRRPSPVPAAPPGRPAPGAPYPFPYPGRAAATPERPHGLALASPGARLAARLIDIAAVAGLNVLANGYPFYLWWQEVGPYFREIWRRSLAGNTSTEGLPPIGEGAGRLQILIMLVGLVLWLLYEVPAVASTGQTLGKRLLGLKVVALESTERLRFGRSFRRWNTMGLPALLWWCGVGFLLHAVDAAFILYDRRRRQALHDRTAYTTVVVLRPPFPDTAVTHPEKESPDEPADPS
jgi:uncharacterized RDD family membrane protein YckC